MAPDASQMQRSQGEPTQPIVCCLATDYVAQCFPVSICDQIALTRRLELNRSSLLGNVDLTSTGESERQADDS